MSVAATSRGVSGAELAGVNAPGLDEDGAANTQLGNEADPAAGDNDSPKIQPVGVRKLDPERIAQYLFPNRPEEEPLLPMARLVQAIVEKEMDKRRKQAEKDKKGVLEIEEFHYSKGGPTWRPDEHHDFAMLNYKIVTKGTTKFGQAHQKLGSKDGEKQTHRQYINFFYRERTREIYVISTNRAWEIVRPYTDYQWPRAFCRHFLDPDRITHVTRESIFGQERKEEISYPTYQRVEGLEVRDRLYTKVVLPVRRNSSLFDLPAFQTPKHQRPAGDVTVTIGVGQFRVHRRLRLENYPDLFEHISGELSKPVPAYLQAKFEVLDYLEPVDDDELRRRLALHMEHQLAVALKNRTPSNYSFCPKYLADYINSSSAVLQLNYEKHRFQLPRYCALQEILDRLRLAFPAMERMAPAEIVTELRKVSVCCDDRSFHPLMDFIEGEIHVNARAYFRINKCFYSLSGDYLSLVHADFRRSLSGLLIEQDDKGAALLHSWGGQKAHGHLTATALKHVGGQSTLDKLVKEKVSYLRLRKQGNPFEVCFAQLKGEILKHPLVRAHRERIEECLAGYETIDRPTLKAELGIQDDALVDEIWDELSQERDVLVKGRDYCYVLNPLTVDAALSGVLDPLCFERLAHETEGHYNESYLDRPGYIVGDRICPFGIEIFDLIRCTDTTTYIVHVKEGFDLHTRDALSQLMNALEMIFEARHANAKTNVLDEWFRRATNPDGEKIQPEDRKYREKLAQQMCALGLDAFKKIFLERKLVFVYAVLDQHVQECSLQHETQLKESFQAEDFKEMVKAGKKTQDLGAQVFAELQRTAFLDPKGRLTSKFYASAEGRFKQDFAMDVTDTAKKSIYQVLSAQASQFNSTIALLELRRTRKQVRRYGHGFKVCQIKRATYDPNKPWALVRDFEVLDAIPDDPSPAVFYEYEGTQYSEESPTRGDGACALHALNSNQQVNGEWAYVCEEAQGEEIGRRAKADYLERLKDRPAASEGIYVRCLSDFVSADRELRDVKAAQLTGSVQQVRGVKVQLNDVYLQALNDGARYARLQAQLKATKPEYAKMTVAALRTLLLQNGEARYNAFQGTLDAILLILNEMPAFEQTRIQLNQAQQALNAAERAFLLSERVQTAYRDAVMDTSYYLSDTELHLAAILYNRAVVLFSQGQESQVFNEDAEDYVWIRHDGERSRGHYSRMSQKA